jgi:hypothetical protein
MGKLNETFSNPENMLFSKHRLDFYVKFFTAVLWSNKGCHLIFNPNIRH